MFQIFVLISPSEAFTNRMFKVLDAYARYRIKKKTALVAIKDLKINYERKNGSDDELLIKYYCSVFTPKENIDYCFY